MLRSGGAPKEVAVPISLFASLRRELEKEAGTLPTVHALHKTGYEAGVLAAGPLHTEAGGDAFSATQETFWVQLRAYFQKRGWGTLVHSAPHPAVGLLSSTDWAEAQDAGHEPDPDASCCFSTGFLSGLLSQLAGGPVAVLEIECRTRGGASCEFAFGSEGAIHDLYGQLLEGADLQSAIGSL